MLIDYDERVSSDLAKEIASSSHLVPGANGTRCRIEKSSRGTYGNMSHGSGNGCSKDDDLAVRWPSSSEAEETAAANKPPRRCRRSFRRCMGSRQRAHPPPESPLPPAIDVRCHRRSPWTKRVAFPPRMEGERVPPGGSGPVVIGGRRTPLRSPSRGLRTPGAVKCSSSLAKATNRSAPRTPSPSSIAPPFIRPSMQRLLMASLVGV